MSRVVSGLFGGGAQEKLLKKQQRDQKAVEAGQQRLREGGRGLLAFIDEDLGASQSGGLLGLLDDRLGLGGALAGRTFGGIG